jgi:hypothetical protein
MNTQPSAYKHFNKFYDVSYEKNKINVWTFNIHIFKEYSMF